jgi:hypothetical protein
MINLKKPSGAVALIPSGCLKSAGLIQINTTGTALTDLACQAFLQNGDARARPLLHFHFSLQLLLLPGLPGGVFVENDRVAIPLFSKCLTS